MHRRRVTARFYVFIALILVAVFFVVRHFINERGSETTVFLWQSDVEQTMECVVIRDEPVELSDSAVRVEYIAKENTEVAAGDEIVALYTAGYSESLLSKLETTRQNIQSYHKTLLGTIVDSDLERLDDIIDIVALDFKRLANQQTRGNLQTVVEQLETAMVNRQEYLRQNKRDDTKLTKLYDEENTRLNSIQSWRKTSTAATGGVVSFYMDGYEQDLTPDNLTILTPSDIRTVMAGGELSHSEETLEDGIYRIVDQDKWYVAALIPESETWSPVPDQDYYLQFEGFEDLVYTARVTTVQKTAGVQLAIYEIDQPIGPMIYQRTADATMSMSLSSMAVMRRALCDENGETGVWINDVPGGTFVPVEVLSVDGDIAQVQPKVDGALQMGQVVLIK